MSLRILAGLAACAWACLNSTGAALAENRLALVIGNANYVAVNRLINPANDARAMAQFLGTAGFQVLRVSDLTQATMLRTIDKFADLVESSGPDTVALVFYAGHGLQVDGENYLVPVDAAVQRESDIAPQTVRLADMMNTLSSVSTKSLIVMLDACRNNPFADVKKSGGRGLAMVDAPSGALISYSTAPGTEALDGDGVNSPYTTALLKVGREEGLPIEQTLKRVRLAVNEATGRQQVPWESSSLTGDFSFFPTEDASVATLARVSDVKVVEAASQVRSVSSWKQELEPLGARAAYETLIREDRVEAYQAFLLAFPSDPLAAVVREILERRQEMIAWKTAASTNTPEAYQTFLAGHGGSEYAGAAARLKEQPRPKRAAVPSARKTARADTGPATNAVIVDAPVVIHTPPRIHLWQHWRHRRPHHAKPGGPDRPPQGKPGGPTERPAQVAKKGRPDTTTRRVKTAVPARFASANAAIPRNVNRAASLPRFTVGNRGSFGRVGRR